VPEAFAGSQAQTPAVTQNHHPHKPARNLRREAGPRAESLSLRRAWGALRTRFFFTFLSFFHLNSCFFSFFGLFYTLFPVLFRASFFYPGVHLRRAVCPSGQLFYRA
jgi:hypothetical protein